ncbi:MAG: ral secretion pathway protein, partial [Myxococcaceae bacterium]|nr:ral secretion pathway protein [Myxococcaceae bacterium]
MSRRAQRGFTLIEVMFAIAILSMAMTVVFSSNIIAARSTMHSRELTRATMMARCRLTEAAAWLEVDRLPATDVALEDPPQMGQEPCCTDGVTCEAQVDRIELPNPATVETAAGNQILGQAASAAAGASFGGATGVRGD